MLKPSSTAFLRKTPTTPDTNRHSSVTTGVGGIRLRELLTPTPSFYRPPLNGSTYPPAAPRASAPRPTMLVHRVVSRDRLLLRHHQQVGDLPQQALHAKNGSSAQNGSFLALSRFPPQEQTRSRHREEKRAEQGLRGRCSVLPGIRGSFLSDAFRTPVLARTGFVM